MRWSGLCFARIRKIASWNRQAQLLHRAGNWLYRMLRGRRSTRRPPLGKQHESGNSAKVKQ